jgi:UDP-glucose 4-epimerase
MAKILITGGAGFIGSHVADGYLALGHEVVIVDDLSAGHRRNVPAGARFYEADVTDSEVLAGILERERPEILNHHAAQKSVRVSVEDPAEDARVNVIGSLRLLELGRRQGVQKVIFISTGGAIYGDATQIPTPEEYPAWPVSPYGIAKLSVEHYLFYYADQFSLPYVVLRYANVYGPRQDPHGEAGVVAIFAERLLAEQECLIYGDGGQTRDYVYVEDVVRANIAALAEQVRGTFNIGTETETSVNELYQQMLAVTGLERPARHAPPRAGEQRRSAVAIGKAARELRWRPEVPLVDGLARTVEFFRERAAGDGPHGSQPGA